MLDYKEPATNLDALFQSILDNVPAAPNNDAMPFRMQIANLGYDDFIGRLGIGRITE